MYGTILNIIQGVVELSFLGYFEFASLAFVLYFLYARTRAPTIIANIFPNIKLNINYYRSSIVNFNKMGNELVITLRKNGIYVGSLNKNSTATVPTTACSNEITNTVKITDGAKVKSLLHGVGTENMLDLTPHARRKPYKSTFDWGIYFPYLAQSLRSRKFKYLQVSKPVMEDANLHRAIKQATDQVLRDIKFNTCSINKLESDIHPPNEHQENKTDADYRVYKKQLKMQEKRALKILSDMRSTINNFLLSLTSWILYKLLPCFLSGVVIHTQQIQMLKKVSEQNPGIPLIFLPLHRSHLDYIMVTFILTNNDIRSPLVAAGNNLQIPVFGGLLRGLGAFFIKRKIDPVIGKKDILYRAILRLYIQHALKMGHNIEFFIEGGRTRTGKPCMPKGGVLSVIVNAFMDHSISDALLVPVSMNYERLVDGEFVKEQKGERKIPESFTKALSGIWKTLNANYGLMRIDFNQPYSLKELVNSYNQISKDDCPKPKQIKLCPRILQHNQSTSSLYGTDVICEEHRNLIDSISRQVVYDCTAATSVMSTNALAFILLTRYREGALDNQLAKTLDNMRLVLHQDKKDMGFSGESLHILNYAADMLGKDLIIKETNKNGSTLIKPVQTIESFIELSYYSHTLTPHFALKSLMLITFHNMLTKQKTENEQTESPGVVRSMLLSAALENSDILRYEYILHKPTQTLENRLEETLDELLLHEMILTTKKEDQNKFIDDSEVIAARRLATHFDDEEEYAYNINEINDDLNTKPDLYLNRDSLEEQHALCEVLAPVAETYLAVAKSLNLLYKNTMLESDFITFVIKDLTDKVKAGICPYGESISTDSVRNCLKLLEKWSAIEICNQNGLRLLSLGTLYETTKESLKTVTDRIEAIVPNYKCGYLQNNY